MTHGVTKETKEARFIKSVCDFFDEEGGLCEEEFSEEVFKLQAAVLKGDKIN